MLCSVKWETTIMNDEVGGLWKEIIAAYFKALTPHLIGKSSKTC